ncbi:MAG: hypothetical protein EPN70_03250 [Paraburkholderia sp.]|uniref:hypothetical protein n=1 Tax=Paraburkholderia sp. TaxID=1926495 RepID=UPI00120AD9BF|nr:hypothetical protein [Paraburkholderia sp.]TAM07281.1 MAG: hypothetical protein EPN70_03250 [Paraburkholderia sp.]
MKTKLITSTLLAFTLAACGSSKDANNGNFEKAINAHFAKDCITIQPVIMAADGNSYPMTVQLQQQNALFTQAQVNQNNANATQPLDVLVKAGVLSVSDGTKKVHPMFGNGEITVPTKVFKLTDMGKKASVSADSTAMCIGHYKVDDVVRFTEPNNTLGQTISQVSFTVSPVEVPDWARNADVQKVYGLGDKLAEHSKVTRTLVLASDGWIDASDFGK